MTQILERIKCNIQEQIYSTVLNDTLTAKFYDDFIGDMYAKMRELAGLIAYELIDVIKHQLSNSADSVGGASHV